MIDPSIVGASEYRTVHALLKSVIGSHCGETEDEEIELVHKCFEELIDWSQFLHAEFRKHVAAAQRRKRGK